MPSGPKSTHIHPTALGQLVHVDVGDLIGREANVERVIGKVTSFGAGDDDEAIVRLRQDLAPSARDDDDDDGWRR
jgi:hypothetical protein